MEETSDLGGLVDAGDAGTAGQGGEAGTGGMAIMGGNAGMMEESFHLSVLRTVAIVRKHVDFYPTALWLVGVT